ncbi:MAG: hypothetical protein JWR26_1485 [Pedosphaera sp.]|nr:hypothetical protein [Pedosphaera sp.]
MRKKTLFRRKLENLAIGLLLLGISLCPFRAAALPTAQIAVQPLDIYVSLLGIATFDVTAVSLTTMTFQWTKNGTNIPGAVGSIYIISNVQMSDQGTYAVKITNGGGTVVSSNATLTVNNAPPTISSQPQSMAVTNDGSATFSVQAVGTAPLTYQWTFNGTNLSGATSTTLTLTHVRATNAGNYTVTVKNGWGTSVSSAASLTVNLPPQIATQPISQGAIVGQGVTLGVVATGMAPLSYQWRLNDVPLAGATNATLSLNNVQAGNAGNYLVVVTNSLGSASSAKAALTISNPPTVQAVGVSPSGFSLQLPVPVGRTFVIQASMNLIDWTPIYTNVSLSGSVSFTDVDSASHGQRYYRAAVQ